MEAATPSAGYSEGLKELRSKPLGQQAETWKDLARGLQPCWSGAFPDIHFDILGRYFDGTARGVTFIFDQVAGGKREVDEVGLCRLLVNHYGFLPGLGVESALEDSSFKALADLVMSPGSGFGDQKATRKSFGLALRMLRVAVLAQRGVENEQLYQYDYDSETITGSFAPGTVFSTKYADGSRCWAVSPQHRVGSRQMNVASIEDYLFSDPRDRPGQVRWLHAHQASPTIFLALAQQYQLRIHTQATLCRLRSAQPQLEVLSKGVGWNWSHVVFPAVFLDSAAKASLRRYEVWFKNISKRTSKQQVSKEALVPPAVVVAVVHLNLAIVWSGDKAKDSTVISASGAPAYLGRWVNSTSSRHGGFFHLLRHFLTCTCCRRAPSERGDYMPVSQDDSEDPEAPAASPAARGLTETIEEEGKDLEGEEDEVMRELRELEDAAEAENNTSFERTFKDVIMQLGEPFSVLRMGSHLQLVFRLILNGTSEYLEAVALYKAAISRIQHLLHDPDEPCKPELIAKISIAKLELGNLVRMVEPFVENVVPKLRDQVMPPDDADALAPRIARHHMADVESNLQQLLHQCKAQILLCESLHAEYNRISGDRMNTILLFLTVVTFLFLPVQVLLGLYGMNSAHMPDFDWWFGYRMFFLLAGLTSTVFGCAVGCLYRSAT